MIKKLLAVFLLGGALASAATVTINQLVVGPDAQAVGGTVSIQGSAPCLYSPEYATPSIVSVSFTNTATAWSATRTYVFGNQVSYGGVLYVAVASSTNTLPGTNPSIWYPGNFAVALVPTDNCPVNGGTGSSWNSGNTYIATNRVTYQGGVYQAVTSSVNIVPSSSTAAWLLVSPSYSVNWSLTSGQKFTQKWVVPSSGPWTVDQVVVASTNLPSVPVPGPPGSLTVSGGSTGQYLYLSSPFTIGFATPNAASGPVVLNSSGNASLPGSLNLVGPLTINSVPVVASTSLPLAGNGAGEAVAATSAGIISLFTGCSGTQYLGADGSCHNGGGTAVNVNGSQVTNPNFNGTTPAPTSGYQNVTFQVSGSNVSAQVPVASSGSGGGSGGSSATFTSQTSVTVPGLGTKTLGYACYDGETNPNAITPNSIVVSSSSPNNVTFTFGAPQTGYCSIVGVGSYVSSLQSGTSWSVPAATSGFTRAYLSVTCYDNSTPKNKLDPSYWTVDSSGNLVIYWANAQTGYALIE